MSKPFDFSRRKFIAAGAALAATPLVARAGESLNVSSAFPNGFLWGASTAGHQIEGNNTTSDLWFLEHLENTTFKEPSGDACNSFMLWEQDLQLVKAMGLNSYRFSLEWARIEPIEGQFSNAMLDYYKQRIERCAELGINPVVTFNHFTTPRWFAAKGGWTNPQSSELFERYCYTAAQHMAEKISVAVTLNEPQLINLLKWILPEFVWQKNSTSLEFAAQTLGVEKFSSGNVVDINDFDAIQANLLKAHQRGRDAIKRIRPDLPVGVSIAVEDDQAVDSTELRDQKRAECYEPWMQAARGDDFIGLQNYTRRRINAEGEIPPPEGAVVNQVGQEVYPPSLGNTVRYVYENTGVPILITEHGIATEDDNLRASFIPQALIGLKKAMDEGIPVLGYLHWSLLDNFEWVFGYGPKFGLIEVDLKTFERTPKPSAAVLGDIAKRNSI